MELIFYSVRDNYNVIDSIKRRGLGKKKSHDEFIAAETTAIHNSGPAPDAWLIYYLRLFVRFGQFETCLLYLFKVELNQNC